jgi:hypothetical protein
MAFQFLPLTSPLCMVFCDTLYPSGANTSISRGGLNLVSVGDTQHCFFVVSTDLVGSHQGSFPHLGGSVVVRQLVESKMAHSCSAHCFADFHGDCVNCYDTIAEETAHCCAIPPRSLFVHLTHCTISLEFVMHAYSC